MPTITDAIGRVLGGRYRIVSALGTGASAYVYLAEDVTLRRRVAVKVLHPHLAGDRSFLRRFQAEAQSAASLNHPNILRVFDWGDDDGEPYLVLEHLSGGSLRDLLDTGYRFTVSQAVNAGLQVTEGLAYAHRRGFVHRDIKPANLLFDEERRFRIADFGLARALAEAAYTEPQGAVVGTARYAAPEQAEGRSVDGRADVYALSLVLYEAVTGEVPFSADTTTATLMGRIGRLLPEHPALGPLGELLIWAAAPNPEERLDAVGFSIRLQSLAVVLPDADPLPALAPSEDSEGANGRTWSRGREPLPRGPAEADDRTQLGAMSSSASKAPRADGRESARAGARHRRWPWAVAAAVLLAAVGGGGVYAAQREKVFTPSRPVPSITGLSLAQAEHALAPGHFVLRQSGRRTSTTVAEGEVISQSPRPTQGRQGSLLKEGSAVSVVVSAGPPLVVVPDLSTVASCAAATSVLSSLHLVASCPPSAQAYSTTVAEGGVVGWSPKGSAPWGSTIMVGISEGPPPITLQDLTGDTVAQATQYLQSKGLVVGSPQKEWSDTVPTGDVTGTAPAGGQIVHAGDTVTVYVSEGHAPVQVPLIVGDSVTAAEQALTGAGLVPGQVYGPKGGKVVIQSYPQPGATVPYGSTVNLYTDSSGAKT